MQRIETCRHRADLLEQAAVCGAQKAHAEFAAMARQWRSCAAYIELLDATSTHPMFKRATERGTG